MLYKEANCFKMYIKHALLLQKRLNATIQGLDSLIFSEEEKENTIRILNSSSDIILKRRFAYHLKFKKELMWLQEK
jgi:hypothetical protein